MPLNLQMNTCVWSLNTKILKSRFLCFGAVSQNAQREMGRLGSGPYPRKAGKVLLRKGGRLRGRHVTSERHRGIEIPWKMKHGRASSLHNQIMGGNASPHTGTWPRAPRGKSAMQWVILASTGGLPCVQRVLSEVYMNTWQVSGHSLLIIFMILISHQKDWAPLCARTGLDAFLMGRTLILQ